MSSRNLPLLSDYFRSPKAWFWLTWTLGSLSFTQCVRKNPLRTLYSIPERTISGSFDFFIIHYVSELLKCLYFIGDIPFLSGEYIFKGMKIG